MVISVRRGSRKNAEVIEAVSQSCLTTGFCLWCQLAFSTYLENATQPHLNNDLQQQLLSGEILGATGLSNPMKSFNDLENSILNTLMLMDNWLSVDICQL